MDGVSPYNDCSAGQQNKVTEPNDKDKAEEHYEHSTCARGTVADMFVSRTTWVVEGGAHRTSIAAFGETLDDKLARIHGPHHR